MKLDLYLTSSTNTNSKHIIYINIRVKTIKLLDENIEVTHCGIGFGSNFLNMILKAQDSKEK